MINGRVAQCTMHMKTVTSYTAMQVRTPAICSCCCHVAPAGAKAHHPDAVMYMVNPTASNPMQKHGIKRYQTIQKHHKMAVFRLPQKSIMKRKMYNRRQKFLPCLNYRFSVAGCIMHMYLSYAFSNSEKCLEKRYKTIQNDTKSCFFAHPRKPNMKMTMYNETG